MVLQKVIAGTVAIVCSFGTANALSLEEKLKILAKSYPKSIFAIRNGNVYFYDSKSPVKIDDGKTKTHVQALSSADVEDMLAQIYPMGPCETRPARNFDPGRVRSDEFFKNLYGQSKRDVSRKLVTINWFGKRLSITRKHGVDKALKKVAREISALPKKHKRPALKTAGTFKWRKIAGTKRLSVHSFAAAIDLDIKYANYWRWSGGKQGNVPKYKNRMPMKIVDIFERHGFIWGGRWYHYDTMHFEYRPELIAISRAVGADACKK